MDSDARRRVREDWPIRIFRLGAEPSEDLTAFTSPDLRVQMVEVLSRPTACLAPPRISMSGWTATATTPIACGAPNRIDLLTSVSGIPTFQQAWDARLIVDVRGQNVPCLGREALIQTKRATGRHKDLGDLEALGEG